MFSMWKLFPKLFVCNYLKSGGFVFNKVLCVWESWCTLLFLFTAVVETDFLTYNGKVVDNKSGSAAADFGPGTINVGGAGSSKLLLSFGNLKKQEVDVQELLQESKSRWGTDTWVCLEPLSSQAWSDKRVLWYGMWSKYKWISPVVTDTDIGEWK